MKNFDSLDERLRADAVAFRPAAPDRLRGRIRAAVREAARSGPEAPASNAGPAPLRRWDSFAAAAALLFVFGAFWFREPAPSEPTRAKADNTAVVERIHGLLGWNGETIAFLGGEPLRAEVENVVDDAERAMLGFVDALPTPFRKRFAAR